MRWLALLVLAACVPAPRLMPIAEIPGAKVVILSPEWRAAIDSTVACLGRRPLVSIDSIHWLVAPRIPQAVADAAPARSGGCWRGWSVLASRTTVLSEGCLGLTRATVVHEALHQLYQSPSVPLMTGTWWHDPRVFARRCGVET